MTVEFARTLTEVDVILKNLPFNDIGKIPMKLRNFIEKNKLKDYNPSIDTEISILDNKLSRNTWSFLAMLYLNYWCETEEEKIELKKIFAENEVKFKEAQAELYSYTKLFNKNKDSVEEKVIEETMVEETEQEGQLVQYDSSPWYKKIFSNITKIFKKLLRK